MTNFSTIKIEIIDRIAILSLNRPEKSEHPKKTW